MKKRGNGSITAVRGGSLVSLEAQDLVGAMTIRMEYLRGLAVCVGQAATALNEEISPKDVASAAQGLACGIDSLASEVHETMALLSRGNGFGKDLLFSNHQFRRSREIALAADGSLG